MDSARIIAVCDLYEPRVELGKKFVNGAYARKNGRAYDGVMGYSHYPDMLVNKDIDAVVISTPDHQHVITRELQLRQGVCRGQEHLDPTPK